MIKNLLKVLKGKVYFIKQIRYERKKIKKLSRKLEIKKLNKNQKQEVIEFWRKYFKNINVSWHEYFATFSFFDKNYIPEDFYYSILEKKLNREDLVKAYEDKNYYDMNYPNFKKPKIILRSISKKLYDDNYIFLKNQNLEDVLIKNSGEFIIKNSIDTCGGYGVKKIKIENGKFLLENKIVEIEDIKKIYGDNFLIQQILKQGEFFKNLHPNSLNTLRFLTLNLEDDEENIEILSIVLRVGNNGGIIDNFAGGGFAVGVNKDDGIINNIGYTKYGEKIKDFHPYTNVKFGGEKIPNFDSIKTKILEWSKQVPPYFKLCSWDIGIDENYDANFIEINLVGQEINFHQINNGPLFGKNTSRYLDKIFFR